MKKPWIATQWWNNSDKCNRAQIKRDAISCSVVQGSARTRNIFQMWHNHACQIFRTKYGGTATISLICLSFKVGSSISKSHIFTINKHKCVSCQNFLLSMVRKVKTSRQCLVHEWVDVVGWATTFDKLFTPDLLHIHNSSCREWHFNRC